MQAEQVYYVPKNISDKNKNLKKIMREFLVQIGLKILQ